MNIKGCYRSGTDVARAIRTWIRVNRPIKHADEIEAILEIGGSDDSE